MPILNRLGDSDDIDELSVGRGCRGWRAAGSRGGSRLAGALPIDLAYDLHGMHRLQASDPIDCKMVGSLIAFDRSDGVLPIVSISRCLNNALDLFDLVYQCAHRLRPCNTIDR